MVFFRESIRAAAFYKLDIPASVQDFPERVSGKIAKRQHKDIVRYLTVSLKILAAASGAAAFSLLFVFFHDFVTQSEYFSAEQISVKGMQRLSEDQVLKQAQIGRGMNILSLNLAKAGKLLRSHPWIADAEVRRDLPSGIHIRITEHKPAAVLSLSYPCSAGIQADPQGKNEPAAPDRGNETTSPDRQNEISAGEEECVRKFIVNTHGELFKEQEESDPDDLPAVEGLGFADISVPGRPRSLPFDAVMEILHIGRRPGSIIPTSAIKRILVDREMGCTLYIASGWLNSDTPGQIGSVRLGYGDYAAKYRKLERILSYLKEKQNIISIQSIDLNNLNRVVVNEVRGER